MIPFSSISHLLNNHFCYSVMIDLDIRCYPTLSAHPSAGATVADSVVTFSCLGYSQHRRQFCFSTSSSTLGYPDSVNSLLCVPRIWSSKEPYVLYSTGSLHGKGHSYQDADAYRSHRCLSRCRRRRRRTRSLAHSSRSDCTSGFVR